MTADPNDPLHKVRQEFTRGLPERLHKIRSGLTNLRDGFDDKAAEQFHVTSHALVGMAATFDAHAMAAHARTLAELGKRWRREATATASELDEATKNVELLARSVHDFVQSVEGGAQPSD